MGLSRISHLDIWSLVLVGEVMVKADPISCSKFHKNNEKR